MKTLEHLTDQPLEDQLSNFAQRELAVVGALHASLAVLKVATDIGALSGEELETIDTAAEAILIVHGFCLARAETRSATLARVREAMATVAGASHRVFDGQYAARVREAMATVAGEVTEELPMLGGGDHVQET